jgi:hypothetical protein
VERVSGEKSKFLMGHILLQATWIHETPDTNSGAHRPSEGADGVELVTVKPCSRGSGDVEQQRAGHGHFGCGQLIRRGGGHEGLQIVAALWLAARRRAQTAAPCRSPLKKKPETKVPRRFRMPCILPVPATNGLPHPGSAQSRGQVRPATGINRPAPEGTAAPEPLATGFP